MALRSWRRNLERGKGFWSNGHWYDLHFERRMPLAVAMIEEMVSALPPLGEGTRICDLACSTGNAGFTVMASYPDVSLVLVDRDPSKLEIARQKMTQLSERFEVIEAEIATDGSPLPGAPYDLIVASLSVHSILGSESADPAELEGRYELLCQGVRESLEPGGHFFVADQVSTLSLYRHLRALERAGFVDVDCAWRQDDFFVVGGRIPA
jgi:tRNA1(Val) A37 N6-methylase TrmN6